MRGERSQNLAQWGRNFQRLSFPGGGMDLARCWASFFQKSWGGDGGVGQTVGWGGVRVVVRVGWGGGGVWE